MTLQETLEAEANDHVDEPLIHGALEKSRLGGISRRIAELGAPRNDKALPHRIQGPIQTFQTQLQPDEFRDELHNSGLSWLLGSLKADVVPLQSRLSRVQIFQLSQERVAVKCLCL